MNGTDPSGPATGAIAPRRRRSRLALAGCVGALALVHPTARLLARLDPRADLIAHFCVPGALLSLAAAGLWLPRRRLVAAGFALLALAQAAPVLRLYAPNPVPPAARPADRLRLLVSNVLVDNPEHGRLADLIRRERPDVVALLEVTPDWIVGLAEIRESFPYRIERPAGAEGLALWSLRPLEGASIDWSASPDCPSLRADLGLGGRPVRLWLIHPPSPVHRSGRAGFEELRALGARIGADRGPRIVLGDFNTTDGSPLFGDFLRATGLRDSRIGFGAQPSWPTWSPLRITIDHVLLSAGLAAADRRLGPSIGSDHLPFLLDVAPAGGPAANDSTSDASDSASAP